MDKNLNRSLVIIIAFIFLYTIFGYSEFSDATKNYISNSKTGIEVGQSDDVYFYSSDANNNIVANNALRARTVYR